MPICTLLQMLNTYLQKFQEFYASLLSMDACQDTKDLHNLFQQKL